MSATQQRATPRPRGARSPRAAASAAFFLLVLAGLGFVGLHSAHWQHGDALPNHAAAATTSVAGAAAAAADDRLPAPHSVGSRIAAAAAAAGSHGGAKAITADVLAALPRNRTISFQVCGGFAEQRAALLEGFVIARRLRRAVVLPDILLDGRQHQADATLWFSSASGRPVPAGADPAAALAHGGGAGAAAAQGAAPGAAGGAAAAAGNRSEGPEAAPFEAFYSFELVSQALGARRVAALTRAEFDARARAALAVPRPPGALKYNATVFIADGAPIADVPARFAPYEAHDHISLDCPLGRLSRAAFERQGSYLGALLNALRPAPAALAALEPHFVYAGDHPFNFLHLSISSPWLQQCAK